MLLTVPHRRKVDEYLTAHHNGDFHYHERMTRMTTVISNSTPPFARAYRLPCHAAELLFAAGSLCYDIVHLNQRGCAIVGGLIAERLLDFASAGGERDGRQDGQ